MQYWKNWFTVNSEALIWMSGLVAAVAIFSCALLYAEVANVEWRMVKAQADMVRSEAHRTRAEKCEDY